MRSGTNGDRWLPPYGKVGIIGGKGEMGRLFRRFFEGRGYTVEIADLDTPKTSKEVIEASDIVVFSVPLHLTVEIIEEHREFLRQDQLVMDLSSLKVEPIRAMLKGQASVVGLHPMFGGSIPSFVGQTIIACPVRVDMARWKRLKTEFESEGMVVKECSPEKHDELMAIIQVLFHLTTMIKGRVIRELGVDIEETLEYTSPVYRMEICLLGRMFAQSGWLYGAISQMNPHTPKIVTLIQNILDEYNRWFKDKNLPRLAKDFFETSSYLGSFCRKAYEESSQLMELGSALFRSSKEFKSAAK
ncbi:MAG: prephenate dehydrogenase/arogenate dehydrogenase family protein [Syntrophobacterales bacterium]|nr:prephenate dehydrogenase/arogenate dehydrogenase family protein [Syntrophobacterales bacterium]